jgi:hypothetical protein
MDEPMYTRIVVEIIFPTHDAEACEAELDDVLVVGLGRNYVVHQRRAREVMTEDRCEQVLGSMHDPKPDRLAVDSFEKAERIIAEWAGVETIHDGNGQRQKASSLVDRLAQAAHDDVERARSSHRRGGG